MNSLLACPHCNGGIPRMTQTCPNCGAMLGRGRGSVRKHQMPDVASQSVFLIVLDALRSGPGKRRPETTSITRAVGKS